jgi:hypothetical protein
VFVWVGIVTSGAPMGKGLVLRCFEWVGIVTSGATMGKGLVFRVFRVGGYSH